MQNRIFTHSLVVLCLTLSACTIVRHSPGDDGGGAGGGGVGPVEPAPPRQVDLLVLTVIDPATANLAGAYESLLLATEAKAALQEIELRQVALAPLYSRVGDEVPLLYGRETLDPSAALDPLPEGGELGYQFASLSSALAYYVTAEGRAHFTNRVELDGHNLANVGANLARYPVYVPGGGSADARAYFGEPGDAFVVVVLSGSRRYCAPADCPVDSVDQADYFTAASDGAASWLAFLGDAGLPVAQTAHVFISTAEGPQADGFYERCAETEGMPPGLVDILEPSTVSYYGPLASGINAGGGHAVQISMCSALANPEAVAEDIVDEIVSALP